MGAQPARLLWRWPPYAAVGFNLVLIGVGLIVRGYLRSANPGAGAFFTWFADLFLLIGAVIGLVASLAVLALMRLHELRGARWLLAARVVAGLVAGVALSSMAAFAGFFLLPTAAALLAGCLVVPAGDPALAGRWFPAA